MKFILAIDYDGTLFDGNWNCPGSIRMDILNHAKRFMNHHGCDVILWTCREERLLAEAIEKCEDMGLRFDAVNTNTSEALDWNLKRFGRQGNTCGRKVYADLYVDDKSPGSIEHFLSIDPETAWNEVNKKDKNE